MKEASGELSMTAVAVVAIAAIGVLFTTLIWPSIKANITRNTNCAQAISCDDPVDANAKTQTCYYCTETTSGGTTTTDCKNTVQCPVGK